MLLMLPLPLRLLVLLAEMPPPLNLPPVLSSTNPSPDFARLVPLGAQPAPKILLKLSMNALPVNPHTSSLLIRSIVLIVPLSLMPLNTAVLLPLVKLLLSVLRELTLLLFVISLLLPKPVLILALKDTEPLLPPLLNQLPVRRSPDLPVV
jgi:hypothetical protein